MSRVNHKWQFLCFECIGDEYLSKEVEDNETFGKCSQCGNTRKAYKFNELVERIVAVIEEHFERPSSGPDWFDSMRIRAGLLDSWLPDGEDVEDLIYNMVGVDEKVAKAIANALAAKQSYSDAKDGEENPYGSEAYYQGRTPNARKYQRRWISFCNEIRYEERFFHETAEPVLKEIFSDLEEMTTYDGTTLIREIIPQEESFTIWRARTAQSKEELKAILKDPTHQLGAPPSDCADAGRMNPKGVSVFYGAMDEFTCVSEIRPPVGSYVVLGQFTFVETVRLIDLEALSRVRAKGSCFDPEYARQKECTAFLRQLVSEISRPVMPGEIDREYLPTQYVASYMARRAHPRLDGIIFPSSQTGGDKKNIVLFNDAREVTNHGVPKPSEVRVLLPSEGEDDESILLLESISPSTSEEEPIDNDARTGPRTFPDHPEKANLEQNLTPTLQLSDIKVLYIESLTYSTKERKIERDTESKDDRYSFGIPLFDEDDEDINDEDIDDFEVTDLSL